MTHAEDPAAVGRGFGESGARTVVTSGFATVDVIQKDDLIASPGGTAVNIARALKTLGWSAQYIGTVGEDPAGVLLKETLQSDGLSVENLRLEPDWTTPIVMQVRRKDDHVWRFSCPVCRAIFAKHRPASEAVAVKVLESTPTPNAFVFDRASLFTLTLANAWSAKGTLVVFEPAGLGRPQLFDRAAAVSDVLKFSEERAPAFSNRPVLAQKFLVETLGKSGARHKAPEDSGWMRSAAIPVDHVVDSAGAGDWTTAGILDSLISSTNASSLSSPGALGAAVRAGQELAAASCRWEGVFPSYAKILSKDSFEEFGCPRYLHTIQH